MQELGLQSSYTHDRGTHSYIDDGVIFPAWRRDRAHVSTASTKSFGASAAVHRVRKQYLDQRYVATLSLDRIQETIRTNNDVAGWNNGLNRRASGRGELPMYLLIKFLHKEATLTALQICLVSERKLKRMQRRKYRELQAKLFELWDQYEAKERSDKRLLKACSPPQWTEGKL